MITPIRQCYDLDDGQMAAWVWPNREKPVLVFAHANGFNGGAYRQMLNALSGRFEIIAPDMRGHGRSTLPADPSRHHNWRIYASDLRMLYSKLDRSPALLAGHSLGASCSLLAAGDMPEPPALALVEPVILPPIMYMAARSPLWPFIKGRIKIAQQARARSNGWPDHDSVLARYQSRATFSNWAEGMLSDYLEDGLKRTTSGVALSCDPEWEAANFEAQNNNLMGALKRIKSSVSILRASHGSTTINVKGLVRGGAKITSIEGGHLAPMEHPQKVSAWLNETADLLGF